MENNSTARIKKFEKQPKWIKVFFTCLALALWMTTPAMAGSNAQSISSYVISSTPALGGDCVNGGSMWVNGPSEPGIAQQAEQALGQNQVIASVEAQGFGEMDGCGTYTAQGIDFNVTLLDNSLRVQTLSQKTVDEIIGILTPFSQPRMGNVRIFDSTGALYTPPPTPAGVVAPAGPQSLPPDALFKKVYVIVYDPLLSNGQKLSEYMHWNSYATITQQTIDFFKQASSDKLNYSVVATTIVTSGWPELTDGFVYTEATYLPVLSNPNSHHVPTTVNYNKIVTSPEFDICGKVNRGEIDEVWVYNAPWFGFWESTLAGPNAYFYNSNPVSGPYNCNRLVPIMGPSVERLVDEAVHNFTHRTEDTMKKVYGSWQQNNTSHNWNKFGLVKAQSPNYSYSGCGSSHYPPNGTSDYNYANTVPVLSNCSDFANYPNLGDPLQTAQPVSCTAWGCTSLGYHNYWFSHFPSNTGCGPDNVATDWWEYIANPAAALFPSRACQTGFRTISGNAGSYVSLKYFDGVNKTVTSDTYGNYFIIVPDQWSGSITPIKDGGYAFTPPSINYSNIQADAFNQNYTSAQTGPEISVSGNNYTIFNGDTTPVSYDGTDFSTVGVSTGISSHSFIILNSGNGILNLTGSPKITVGGLHASDFTITTQPTSPIGNQSSTSFTVAFDPSADGLRSATISITNDDISENPYTFFIQGTGVLTPEIDVLGNGASILDGASFPTSMDHTDFGSVAMANGTITRTFTIANYGGSSLSLTGTPKVSITGTHAGDFTVSAQPVSPITPGGSTTFLVEFNPSGEGVRTASISISNNDSDENPYNFSIQGMGLAYPQMDVQGNSISIANGDTTPGSDDNTDFGSVDIPGNITSRTFTIHNSGDGNLYLYSYDVYGNGTPAFSITTPPVSPVPPNGSTSFTITFAPSASGTHRATIMISTNQINASPYYFSIQGFANGPEMDVLGNSSISDGDNWPDHYDNTDFGNVPLANGTKNNTFTIFNLGNRNLELTGSPLISISGLNASDFSVSTLPQSSIPESGSTQFAVQFDPSGLGIRTATISIDNNDTDENPYNFTIQGTGYNPPEIDIRGNDQSILIGDSSPSLDNHTDFGNAAVSDGTTSRTYTIYNTGMGNLTLTNSPLIIIVGSNSSDFSVTSLPTSPITPGASSSFSILFNPVSAGLKKASIYVINDDTDEMYYTFGIQGTGTINPEIDVQGKGISIPSGDISPTNADDTDFGEVLISTVSTAHTFTIRNTGDETLNLNGASKVEITGPDAGSFTVSSQPASPLAPNNTTTFSILFNPTESGLEKATISISNTDTNENPYTFAIQGMGVDPSTQILSILRANPNPSNSSTISFNVNFSGPVTGVDKNDFALTTSGVTGALISSVSGSGSTYTVTVNTGTGRGSIRLELPLTASITSLPTNLPYTNGETYTINKNEAPIGISLSNLSVIENRPSGQVVGVFTSSDPDVDETFTYTLINGPGSDDNAAFAIEGNTLKSTQSFNHLAKSSLSIRIRTTDSFGAAFENIFTLTITDSPSIFNDVSDSFWAAAYIERLFNAGITGGCGDGNYCPDQHVTRAQMAVFLLKGIHGPVYVPPGVGNNTGFNDVTDNHWAAAWIKQLAAEAITGGCGSGNYCPESTVTRAQMAVFLLKAMHSASYSPPPATGTFADVSADHWAAAWIEQLAAESITSGCGNGNYCPEDSVTRAQMAIFLVKAFNLP